MEKILRTADKRKSTSMEDFYYYGTKKRQKNEGLEMANNEKRFLRPLSKVSLHPAITKPKPIKASIEKKDLEKNYSKQFENELNAFKEANQILVIENEALKESNSAAKAQIEEIKAALIEAQNQNESLKRSNETLVIQNEALKDSHVVGRAQFDEVKAALIEVEKQNESLKRSKFELSTEIEQLRCEKFNQESSTAENHDGTVSLVDGALLTDGAVSINNDSSFKWVNVNEKKDFISNNRNLKKNAVEAVQFVNYIAANVFEETKESFVRSAVKLIFTKRFFIDQLVFKHEDEKTCVKDTKILKCLEEAVLKKFDDANIKKFVYKMITDFKRQLRKNEGLWDE